MSKVPILIHASSMSRYTGENKFADELFPTPEDHFWSVNVALGTALGMSFEIAPSTTESGVRVHSLAAHELAEVMEWLKLPSSSSRDAVCNAIEAKVATAATQQQPPMSPPASLSDVIIKDYAKQSGTRLEANDASLFSTRKRQKVVINKRKYTKKLMEHNGYTVLLVGELDGELEDGCIVEMKRRMKRLSQRVWPQERVQVHCYMWLRDVRRARIVETFNETQAEHVVDFDDAFWQGCVSRMSEFLEKVIPNSSICQA